MSEKASKKVFFKLLLRSGKLKTCRDDEEDKVNGTIYFLQREKVHLGFFALRALQFLVMSLVFQYYVGKSGLNIFPDLKSTQIKYMLRTPQYLRANKI